MVYGDIQCTVYGGHIKNSQTSPERPPKMVAYGRKGETTRGLNFELVSIRRLQRFSSHKNVYQLSKITIKSAIPQRQTNEWCRITCRPGSANYLKYKVLTAD